MGRSGQWHWNQGKKPHRMDDEDVEFIRAVDKFRQDTRRIPTALDYLAIVKSLGYRKAELVEAIRSDMPVLCPDNG